jgi:hypothetical protein
MTDMSKTLEVPQRSANPLTSGGGFEGKATEPGFLGNRRRSSVHLDPFLNISQKPGRGKCTSGTNEPAGVVPFAGVATRGG